MEYVTELSIQTTKEELPGCDREPSCSRTTPVGAREIRRPLKVAGHANRATARRGATDGRQAGGPYRAASRRSIPVRRRT